MEGFDNVPAQMREEPLKDPAARRRLRITLAVVGSVLVVSGLLVVGMLMWVAAGISQWGNNK